MRIEKKDYPQVYLEEYKYKMKKTKTFEFINTELDTESELESETELESKLESDSESEYFLLIVKYIDACFWMVAY